MANHSGRPEEDDTKTSAVSPVPAGQEDAAKAAAAPKAANEGDATNPQTDRAAADTEEKPEPAGPAANKGDRAAADTEEKPEPAGPGKPAAPADAATDEVANKGDSTPDTPDAAAPDSTDTDEPSVDWEARAVAAEKELSDLKLKVAAQNAAAAAGLPPEAAQFLRGDNDEEIKAAAETLASLITPANPLDRNPVPRGQEPDDRPDLAELGARLFRN